MRYLMFAIRRSTENFPCYLFFMFGRSCQKIDFSLLNKTGSNKLSLQTTHAVENLPRIHHIAYKIGFPTDTSNGKTALA